MSGQAVQAVHQILEGILQGMVPAEHSEPDISPLTQLAAWFREDALGSDFELDRRLDMLLSHLADHPEQASQVRAWVEQLLEQWRYRFTFAELGILGNETFGQAMRGRLFQRLLPATVEEKTLRESLNLIFPKARDHEWLSAVSAQRWIELIQALGMDTGEGRAWSKIKREMLEALEILAVRIAAMGIDSEVVRCVGLSDRHTSPFVEQHLELRNILVEAYERMTKQEPLSSLANHLDVLLDQCNQQIKKAYQQARVQGISFELSMQLIRLQQSINRMRTLLELLGALPCEKPGERAVSFFIELTREENRKHSIRDLWAGLSDQVALRVTEYASRSGERYATETSSEYWSMARAAMGAGLIVAVLAFNKSAISGWALPPFWEAVFFSLNYGVGFMLIHLFRFTLATKQPAMTAALIAAAMETSDGKLKSVDRVAELLVQVARTQFVSILGNVVMAFAIASGVAALWFWGFDDHFLSSGKTEKALLELNPVESGAIAHAAIAGVFLYVSGLMAGYYDNLASYYKLPDRLRKLPWLRRVLGVVRQNQFADYISANFGSLAGNFMLGCFLGSAGFIGLILGLPIDIRHITFAAANLAYGFAGSAYELPWPELILLTSGVFLIGLTNLAVSFTLAFVTAMRARGVRVSGGMKILGRLAYRLTRTPRDFFYPPRQEVPPKQDEPKVG